MKLLITGGRGQLGRSLVARGGLRGYTTAATDLEDLDIRQQAQVRTHLETIAPDVVVNAAAYTAVDRAEDERELAYSVNRDGAGILARECAARSIPILHVSTDYVFDGRSVAPYREEHPVNPLGIYGASKAEGEQAVLDAGGCVVRTSWLFSARGPSFVHTILRLAKTRPTLRIVADQHGCPTFSDDLADAILALIPRVDRASLYHYCGDGPTTWHGLATEIVEQARRHAVVECREIEPITTAEYPTAATRPAYSVLDTSKIRSLGIIPPPWTLGLRQVVGELLRSDTAPEVVDSTR